MKTFDKKKIAIIWGGEILPYRFFLIDFLSEYYELDVFTKGTKYRGKARIIALKTNNINKIKIQRELFFLNFNKYEKIIVISNFSFLFNLIYLLFGNNRKIISWGFWPTKNKVFNLLRRYIIKRINNNIFYSVDHKRYYSKLIKSFKSEVANNTVDVEYEEKYIEANSILFIGTFNKRKGIIQMIKIIKPLFLKYPKLKFVLVGDGLLMGKVKNFIKTNNLEKKVILKGRIIEPKKLNKLYNSAFCEISLNQAGLSIVRSLGHATPFITLYDAISGGEKSNLIDGYNGYLLKSSKDLIKKVEKIYKDKKLRKTLKSQSLETYKKKCNKEQFLNAFVSAIES